MKVFVSSLISGFEPFRSAARAAISVLRHEPIMAEDFGATPTSPQLACLAGLRQADLVVLLLGEHYGTIQPSGISATHEEYRDAKGRKPVIAFVQEGVTPDDQQQAFIAEVQAWRDGLFRGGFGNADDLRDGITRALHDYEIARAVGAVDPQELAARSLSLLGATSAQRSGPPSLQLSIAGGPRQRILRPVEIEAAQLNDDLTQAALFGETKIFDRTKGVETSLEGAVLALRQDRDAAVRLDEEGGTLVQLPAIEPRPRGGRDFGGFPAIIEEYVQQQLLSALTYSNWLLERVDPTQRLTHVSISARIDGGDYVMWRTQAEHDASPTSGSMGFGRNSERAPVQLALARAALRLNRTPLVEDLVVPLRRAWQP